MSANLGSLTLQSDEQIPILKSFVYNASKTALNVFTVHLADELRNTKIKVFSAHPGWVKTAHGTDAVDLEVEIGAIMPVQLALSEDE